METETLESSSGLVWLRLTHPFRNPSPNAAENGIGLINHAFDG